MVKKIQGTISSKSATLYLHTFNLYWRILGFQEEKQNQFWNINHTLRRTEFRNQNNFDILYLNFHSQHPQTGIRLVVEQTKIKLTRYYFSWVFPLNFPAQLLFFFCYTSSTQLVSFTVWLQKEHEAPSEAYSLDFSGKYEWQLKPNKRLRSTYMYDPDSPAMVEGGSPPSSIEKPRG